MKTLILSTNWRVWVAIAAARVERNLSTMAEVRDALNARRNRRAPADPRFVSAFSLECWHDIRVWGRIERSFSERYSAAMRAAA